MNPIKLAIEQKLPVTVVWETSKGERMAVKGNRMCFGNDNTVHLHADFGYYVILPKNIISIKIHRRT